MTRIQRLTTHLLAFVFLLATIGESLSVTAQAASLSTADVQAAINQYYSAVSAGGVPHWNAKHSEATLKSNANS